MGAHIASFILKLMLRLHVDLISPPTCSFGLFFHWTIIFLAYLKKGAYPLDLKKKNSTGEISL